MHLCTECIWALHFVQNLNFWCGIEIENRISICYGYRFPILLKSSYWFDQISFAVCLFSIHCLVVSTKIPLRRCRCPKNTKIMFPCSFVHSRSLYFSNFDQTYFHFCCVCIHTTYVHTMGILNCMRWLFILPMVRMYTRRVNAFVWAHERYILFAVCMYKTRKKENNISIKLKMVDDPKRNACEKLKRTSAN